MRLFCRRVVRPTPAYCELWPAWCVPGTTRDPIGGNGIPATYVPFHNAPFHAVTLSWAEAIGITAVFIGGVADDSSGDSDLRPEGCRTFRQFVREGTVPGAIIEIVTRVNNMRKWEIVKLGMELGAPLDRSCSCCRFVSAACGNPIAYRVQVET